MVQVDVIRRYSASVEADSFSDYKRNRFGFGLAYYLGGYGATVGLVQHLVREFMDQS